MRSSARRHAFLALATGLVASFLVAGTVAAAETTLTATLAGSDGTDADGSGTATVVLDPEAGTACWEMSVENIDPVTISHIHVGAEGEDGAVVVDLDLAGFETTSEGCNEAADAESLQAIIDDPAGYYVNVHNEAYPMGAIRGQLAAAASPPNTAVPADAGFAAALIGLLTIGLAAGIALRMRRGVAPSV